MIIPEVTIPKITPVLGTVLYDEQSKFERIRDYTPISASFPTVYAHHVEHCHLTDEIVVHVGAKIYVDSSIHCAGTNGRQAERILKEFSEKISEYGNVINKCYVNQSALLFHNEGVRTWGHFVVQILPRALVYLEKFPNGKLVLPRDITHPGSSYFKLLKAFGISEEKLLPVDAKKSYVFRELTLLDFLYDFPRQLPQPLALRLLAQATAETVHSESYEIVFIERVSWTGRSISNQSDLDVVLAAHGVPKIVLGEKPVDQQISVWRSARLIIATLGSDLTNMVFGTSDLKLLVLSPDWFGDTFFYNLAVMKQVQWNELRCGAKVGRDQT